jgi:2-dehydro-3-deoxyphosphooctonate aldolase (KDO 8-P synthase)
VGLALDEWQTQMNECSIGNVRFGQGKLALIAGPCMAESLELCLEVGRHLADVCRRLDIGYVFKASFDKANRSSNSSYRGPGLEQGLAWLAEVKRQLGLPVISDIHEPSQAAPAAAVLDALQIPAFLCRQTDLLEAAGATGKAVNVKKGQFMAPQEMKQAVEKVRGGGGSSVLLTERGTFFGYNRLVNDMRGIPIMRQFAPVVFDATHSIQEPGGLGGSSGGQPQYAPVLAKAALAAGADALFIETHPRPAEGKSDAACMLPLADMEKLLADCVRVYRAVR